MKGEDENYSSESDFDYELNSKSDVAITETTEVSISCSIFLNEGV